MIWYLIVGVIALVMGGLVLGFILFWSWIAMSLMGRISIDELLLQRMNDTESKETRP